MGWLADETGLEKNAANFVALTPLSFLNRARDVFPDKLAVVYGDHRVTYRQYHERCTRLASGLVKLGVQLRRCCCNDPAKYPRPYRGAFWRSRLWCNPERDQHTLGRKHRVLHF